MMDSQLDSILLLCYFVIVLAFAFPYCRIYNMKYIISEKAFTVSNENLLRISIDKMILLRNLKDEDN
jgi:hypothetical protein